MARGTPARALIGWMNEASALLALAGQWENEAAPSLQHRERHQGAVGAVAALPALVDQKGVLETPGQDVAAHLEALWASAPYLALNDDRWSAAVADLTRLVAMQPLTTVVELPGPTPAPDDMAAIAALTLPIEAPPGPPATFDARHRWWVVSSDSMNLRVRDDFATTDDEYGMTLGFRVALQPSYLRAVLTQDRIVLIDGYRRALALLAAGITRALLLVRTLEPGQPLGLRESLPLEVLARPRPPLLPDLLDDAVSAAVVAPKTRSVVIVQALEVTEAVLD